MAVVNLKNHKQFLVLSDSNLRTFLGMAISGIQLSSRENVVSLLKNRGFLFH